MDVRRRHARSPSAAGDSLKTQKRSGKSRQAQALPVLPMYLTNAVFFSLFFSVAYFLLHRWRDKIRTSKPLHVVTASETAAILSLVASIVYLLGFFGVGFVHHIGCRPSPDDELSDDEALAKEDARNPGPCPAALVDPDTKAAVEQPPAPAAKVVFDITPVAVPQSDDDEEIVGAVISGAVPSYSLESRLGGCRRAAAIRREVVQRMTGRSLEGLPLDGFDYESILGQCCEMPVGFLQIPVGVAGPLLLDEKEYTVPMATTEGCLVASTNRGCKAIHLSGGASSCLLRDGMTRAPVVRFSTAKRAAQLKCFLEDPLNLESFAVAFNKYFFKPFLFFFFGEQSLSLLPF